MLLFSVLHACHVRTEDDLTVIFIFTQSHVDLVIYQLILGYRFQIVFTCIHSRYHFCVKLQKISGIFLGLKYRSKYPRYMSEAVISV